MTVVTSAWHAADLNPLSDETLAQLDGWQDHNGFSHQDPGFIDHVVNKRAEVVRVYHCRFKSFS